MLGRAFTIAKYELRQYRRSYFEQFFIFAGILLIFLMVSGTSHGAAETPSSFGIYRVGYLRGSAFGNYTHYSLTMVPYETRDDGMMGLREGAIDVWADMNDSEVSFMLSDTPKGQAALKRLKQVILYQKRDQIYALADANDTLDGILLPIKVKAVDVEVDYSKATDPNVYIHRVRYINRSAQDRRENGPGFNILDIEAVRRMNLTEYLMGEEASAVNESSADVGFTLPEEWDVPFVFKNLYDNMAVVSVSILLSMLLTLSLAREKVNRTIITVFQTPSSRLEILVGKSLPYFALMAAINLAYGLTVAEGLDSLKVFYIFTVLSITLVSFAIFTVIASKNYREVTFMSTLSLMSFLMFIVLPNVFSGINVLAFISPLDTITSIQNNAGVGFADVFLSLLPYKFLSLFFISFSLACFNPEVFDNTPNLLSLIGIFYDNMRRQLGDGIKYAFAAVSLLVPFAFILQTLIAYVIMPLGSAAPYASILALALIEELIKIMPYTHNRRLSPMAYGLTAGVSFFLTEKVFNLYLISKVYSYLPTPYTVFVLKGLAYTMVLHVFTATLLAYIVSKAYSKENLLGGLALTTLIHFTYNVYMMGGGLFR